LLACADLQVQRRYEADDLDWLTFLLTLRDTGMSIANMKLFASLRRR
jgi:DNA-binding transcriptional MerR regulator